MISARISIAARCLLVALTTCLMVTAGRSAEARGRIPVLLQVTSITEGDVEDPRIRSQDGSRVVFTSDGDVLGPSDGTKQVYLYEVESRVLSQITSEAGHDSDQAARPTDQQFAGGRPEYVAFVSTADLDPSVGNADGNPEIFIWELITGAHHQLTDTLAPIVNANPYASDNGKCLVFDSNGDLDNNPGDDSKAPPTGFTNADGSREVFVYSLDSVANFPMTGRFTQISNGPGGTTSWRPVIGGYWFARQCQSTVYMSDFDQTGGSRLGMHIYVFSRPSATISAMDAPAETPNGQPDGNYLYPAMSSASQFARGPFTVFETSADLWRNASIGSEVFRYRIFHPRMTQYTGLAVGDVTRPVISDGGGILVYESTGQMLNPDKRIRPDGSDQNLNLDGNKEIFWQKGRRKVSQLTRSVGCENAIPSVRDNGTAVAFRSTCDLIPGSNTAGNPQVFLWAMVRRDNPLACTDPSVACQCTTADRCCNEANGCLTVYKGRMVKPAKKKCLDKPRGC